VTHVLVEVEPLPPLLPVPVVPGTPDPDEHGIGMTVPLTNGPQPPLVAVADAGVGQATAENTQHVRSSVQSANPM
jgi:hypothetical protein